MDGEALARRVQLSIVRWVAGASVAGAVLTYVYLGVLADFDPSAGNPQGLNDDEVSLVVFIAYLLAVTPFANWRAMASFAPVRRWLSGERPPTADEREAALSQPGRQAGWSFLWWLGAAITFTVLNLIFGSRFINTSRVAIGIVTGGVVTSTLTFLVVERLMRPVFALVLAGEAPARRRIFGMRPRLILSWALGSGVPVLGILRTVTIDEDQVNDPTGAVVFLCVQALVAGGLMLTIAAKSVVDPLEDVRRGLRRVQDGDLDTEVTVDDGGEVGLLQSGFNQMVAGLRERRQLQDLFGRHVGEQVARQALERSAGLGGEQREASVLFVDLIGSTGLALNRPASEVVATLNDLFDAVVSCAGAEGGWVNKFEGDGAMCVFGAPGHHPEHAAAALRAARGMAWELARRRLNAGIGVSSGTVVAGNVGTLERYEYTVIGDPVNEAARLTELAKTVPGRVVASGEVVCRAGETAGRWREYDRVVLRGRTGETVAFVPA